MNPRRDFIATARSQWRDVRPDLDTSSIEVIGRVLRCAAILRQRLDAALADEGLNRAEFDLLCALRRTDAAVTPGRLNELTVSSGAATTKRVHQLAGRGLLERTTDERDRRSARVKLTEPGRDLLDRAFARNVEIEQHLLAGLGEDERETVASGLSGLLRSLEGSADAAITHPHLPEDRGDPAGR